MPISCAFLVITLAKFAFRAGEVLGDGHGGVVGGERDESIDGVGCANGRTRLQPELGRRLARGIGRHHELRIGGDGAGAQIGEEDVEGHHLGERGWGPGVIGGLLMQDAA